MLNKVRLCYFNSNLYIFRYDGNDKNQQHDIAVLKVTKTIEFDTTIRSACIEYNLRGNDLVSFVHYT